MKLFIATIVLTAIINLLIDYLPVFIIGAGIIVMADGMLCTGLLIVILGAFSGIRR